MREQVFSLVFCYLLLFLLLARPLLNPMREITSEEKQELVHYLKTHGKTPEEYGAEKFSNYNIVFIGEYHCIKHDVELIHKLIPYLYRTGVYNLGIEFGAYEYQNKVDLLITANKHNEDLARWLMFKFTAFWS